MTVTTPPNTIHQVSNINTTFTIRSLRCGIIEHPIIPERVVFSCAGRHDRSRYLIVAMESNEGVIGYGEAACVPIWSGETAVTAAQLLDDIIMPALVGQSFASPEMLCDELDRILIDNPFLKGAVDAAAWDLVGKTHQIPVSDLIGDREPVKHIPTRASIGAHDLQHTVALAQEFRAMGIRVLKFKTGLDTESDARRLAAVREALGNDPILTVDYNGGLPTAPIAIDAINALLPFDVSIVEQPTPRHRLAMMAQVRQHVDIPILADESIFNRAQLEEAVACQAMDILSLYPGKNGGLTRSWQMAQQAQAAGIPCVIGSNLETEVGQAAMSCLAASHSAFPVDRYACDLLSAMYYENNILTPIRPVHQGCYVVPTGPGLGIDVQWKTPSA